MCLNVSYNNEPLSTSCSLSLVRVVLVGGFMMGYGTDTVHHEGFELTALI